MLLMHKTVLPNNDLSGPESTVPRLSKPALTHVKPHQSSMGGPGTTLFLQMDKLWHREVNRPMQI